MDDKRKTKPRLIAELQELRRQVAQLEAAATVQNSQTPLRMLAETAASAIFIFQDSVFRYTNPATSRLTGYTAAELLGANIWGFVHPEHREEMKNRMLAWLRGEPVAPRSEFKILTKAGESLWIDADSTFVEFEGRPAALTIAYDSTATKLAEEALKASEERFSRIIETAQEAIWIVDAKANTTYVNERLAEMLGYGRDELLGRSVFDFVDPEDRQEAVKYLERGRSGVKQQHDFRFRGKDDSELWTMVSTTPLFDDGCFVGGLAMLIDITERRRSEEALKESEARMQAAIENMPFELWARDRDGRCIIQNPYSVLQWGSFTGTFPYEIAPDHQVLDVWAAINRRAYAGEVVKGEFEVADGQQAGWYYYVVGPIRVEGEIRGILGVNIDITERKRTEEALRQSEAKFRVLAQTAPSVILIFRDSKIVYVNSYAEAHSGYSEQELRSMDFWEMIHPDHRQEIKELGLKRLRGEPVPSRYEVKLITKSGEERWVDFAASSFEFEGKPSVLGVAFDITDSKKAEQALRESEYHLQTILDNCPAMIFQKDLDGRYLQINRQFERAFNLTPEQVLGLTDAEIFTPELAVAFRATDRTVLEAGRSLEFEESAVYPDGLHTYIVHKFPLQDAAGKVYAVGGISTDITPRKRAEDDLRKQKEILQKIFDHIPVMIRFLDEDGNIKLVNREWERTLGWTQEEAQTRGMNIFAELYPDPQYRQFVLDFIAASTGEFTGLEVKAKDGRVIHTSFANVSLEDGTNIGIGRDVTERKRAEDLLRRQTAQLAALHEIQLEISAESDLSRILEVVTQRAAELLGASHCSTYIRDRDEAALTLVASLEAKFVGLCLESGEGLAGRALVSGAPQGVDDYGAWQGRASVFETENLGPSLAAPLKWQQTVIGAISLSRRRGEERFTDEDSRLLEQLAAEAAIAIHQATLFDDVQESQRRQQILSRRLIDAQEAERKRLARELHDQIGQALTAVQINLQALQSVSDVTAGVRLDDCLTAIDDALQQVHDLSLDLRPSLLDDLGLVAALRWYVDRLAIRAGLVKCFHAEVPNERLAPQVETACFRIAQEALTNVLRHAHAKTVWVLVKQQNEGLQLVVRDDGAGFDVRSAMSRAGVNASLGLQGMKERAGALGGNVDIVSQQGKGVEVLASFPLR